MDVAGMMYTKEGEFEVTLTGGSPWGFMIRTKSGNGLYNRGKVIVAKVEQGGRADNSGNIHVGDEILAVNGLEFDNEQQASQYVKDAQKELILKVKRGQDRRRMNIRLAGELPNYFAKALESPVEKNVYTQHNTDANMISNNKRSSKEYEKDLSYTFASNTVNAVIDYPSGQSGHSQINVTRLTRSTADLSEYNQPVDQYFKDTLSSSPPRKNYNSPGSQVQRVRITSTNVTSPAHKYSPESDKSSPSSSFDDSLRHSESRSSTPAGYSVTVQKPFNSSAMEELNRTWPSVSISDAASDGRLGSPKSTLSVSAAKSHFEQISMARDREQVLETERRSRSTSSLAPKPPSRTSSFRSARLSSSSSAVFSETTPSASLSSSRQDRLSPSGSTPTRKASSSEDLDKPLPPKRYSHSTILSSFRSKKPSIVGKMTASSSMPGQGENGVYQHVRTQSLPSSRIVAGNLSSRSWVMNEGTREDTRSEDASLNQRLPRSSSFSRARVIETSPVQTVHKSPDTNTRTSRRSDTGSPFEVTVKTVQRDDSKAPIYATKSDVKYTRSSSQTGVIQAFKTGEVTTVNENTRRRVMSSQDEEKTNNKWAKQEQSMAAEVNKVDEPKAERRKADIHKPEPTKIEVPPKSILKREVPKPEIKKDKPKLSKPVPVLKEDSLMQRLLMESQGQGGSTARSTAAAIKEEINQRTGKANNPSRPDVDVSSTGNTEQQQRSEIAPTDYRQKENLKVEELKQNGIKESKMDAKIKYESSQKEMNDSTAKVDNQLGKLMAKLDSPPRKHRALQQVDSLGDDNVFPEPAVNTVGDSSVVNNELEQPFESNIDDPDDVDVNSSHERNDVMNAPSPEFIVKSECEAVVESHPSLQTDNNDNLPECITPEKNELQTAPKMKKTVETKYADTLSPADGPLKAIHSRENSASSLLEETLESAKTIASIYSVEGPTRSPDGEDSFTTASEMRRHSLAKRVRRRPKLDSSTFTPERTAEPNLSFTPETMKSSLSEAGENENEGDDSGNRSTGSSGGSRPDSGILSPKLEALEEQKEILISSMKKKVELLQEQESEINEEMKQNDELGKRVAGEVKARTNGSEYSKYELFVGELNNIIGLLLSLTQRMHRYEVMLQDIDLAEENGREKRDVLMKRIERVKQQYEEACRIKEINDKRGETVAKIVEDYCSDEDFADFQHFVDMKTQLALTQAEIRDKIKLGEEKLKALTSAQIDWTTLDLSIK